MNKISKIALFITILIISLPISACGQRIKFLSSTVVPAAQGVVKIKKDGNKNYQIKIHVDNLAEPERLTPSKAIYVVWMVTENNMAQNIGKIETSKKFLSSKLKASFQSVSASKPIKIFITAEKDQSIQYSSSEIILTTETF